MKMFSTNYPSEHNIDTIIQDDQLVPQYFRSAVYTEEIESKNEESRNDLTDYQMSGQKQNKRANQSNMQSSGNIS